jgi:hypothetical protein
VGNHNHCYIMLSVDIEEQFAQLKSRILIQ